MHYNNINIGDNPWSTDNPLNWYQNILYLWTLTISVNHIFPLVLINKWDITAAGTNIKHTHHCAVKIQICWCFYCYELNVDPDCRRIAPLHVYFHNSHLNFLSGASYSPRSLVTSRQLQRLKFVHCCVHLLFISIVPYSVSWNQV